MEFIPLCVCIASSIIISCMADHHLPAPTALSYTWSDAFALNVSWNWEKPKALPDDCKVIYELHARNTETQAEPKKPARTKSKHYTFSFLTEEMGVSGHWRIQVQVLGLQSCEGLKSRFKSDTVRTTKLRAELVKDFKCLINDDNQTICSWIPVDPSLHVTVSYRYCGSLTEDIGSIKRCVPHSSSGGRNRCVMRADPSDRDVCVLVESDAKLETFKPKLVIRLPKMSITEDGYYLNLTWTPPNVGRSCSWDYEICYKECNKPQPCQIFKATKETIYHGPLQVLYNELCLYEFIYNAATDQYCTAVRSEGSGSMTYGANKSPPNPRMLMIGVAIALSLAVSISVVLCAYCCRRHSDVFSPVIPDPSSIFKEMMMDGSQESKMAREGVYMPVPEETCQITVVTENS
ncbi:uncharacterized protein LOC114480700 [Gouania willdenowi]|uniref:Uncharacterized LOC114480700 n=1 Tax=Gouania willdenowi TaxID=441366 RepID=A0A8C5HHN3_GOUWI|nr:uncharacterized protein LOC114480700 [Gouania willdenowi]